MTSSIGARNRNRVDAWARLRDPRDQSRQVTPSRGRRASGHATRRLVAVAVVLTAAVVAVLLLEAAGFDPRVAAASIAVFTGDLFVSWILIARAGRGSPRRRTRARA